MAFRSFDRQWIIPDNRLDQVRPDPNLWEAHSEQPVYLTAPEARIAVHRPRVDFLGSDPRSAPLQGRGGRVYPLWRNAEATVSNIKPSLLAHLALASAAPSRPKT